MLQIIVLISLASATVLGQFTRETSPWVVIEGSDTLQMPFLGGLNDPKPNLLDLDQDGLIDLMVGEAVGKLSMFSNQGTVSQPNWVLAQDRLAGIDIGTWYNFYDIDGDGDQDLFCDSRTGGIKLYENITSGPTLEFILADTLFGGFLTGFNNTPAFADLDGDNDLDFFFGNLTGTLEFHENIGDSANPSFIFVTDFYDSILAFPQGRSGERHGFSNIRFVDIDADSDFDLFYGDIFNKNMYYFPNLGTPSVSDLTWETQDYLPSQTLGFNHPTFADVDNDGDADLVLGSANNTAIDNLLFYRNNGTASLPNFLLETSNLLSSIDVGSNGMPALADLDADGDNDLIVGSINGQLRYYENTGSKLQPEFTLVSDFYQSISVGGNSAPTLVDIDGDADLDLFIGNQSGKIEYWRNDGNAAVFSPVLVSTQYAGIKVDVVAIPRFADLNDDGLLDLVVGEWDFNGFANILLYQNIGTAQAPNHVQVTRSLINIGSRNQTVPCLYDWNDDGRIDLLVGNRMAGIDYYLNTSQVGSFPDSNSLVLQTDTIPGHDDGWRLALCFADINLDGDEDLFVGERDGGVNFYRHNGSCCIGLRGNVDNDPTDELNVSDLTELVAFLFKSGPPLECQLEANFNGDPLEQIDVSDLTAMVGYMFLGSELIFPCPPAD